MEDLRNKVAVKGQITKVSTTADQCVRVVVDIPREDAPVDMLGWVHGVVAMVRLLEDK